MIRVGLLGNPVVHSRSPQMHNAAFAALGMDANYELWHTEDNELEKRVLSVRNADIAGANVTVPHKQAVMPFLDEISEAASRIGAVNTIIRQNNILIGDNTDAYGFSASVKERFPDFALRTAIVLGAGGASRAVIVALQQMGAKEILIANRTLANAVQLAKELEGTPLAWEALKDALPSADILVNTTSLGWHDEIVLEHNLLATMRPAVLLADLTYRQTPFLRSAHILNLRSLDGLGMLIHQGARSFELWFGVTPPIGVMKDAITDS